MLATMTLPRIEGPIPVIDALGPLFGGALSPIGLADPAVADLLPPHGYVEEEFFVSGLVAGQAYTTSLLVRRPRDPAQFSGLVALEPVHLQGALGLWQSCHAAILEGGHAWAAVGSQRGGVEGPIKLANPARYAGLNVPLPRGTDEEQATTAFAKWSQGDFPEVPAALFAIDTISNEILTQVGTVFKTNAADGPLPGLTVQHLILGGASQTGIATLNYIRQNETPAGQPDRARIYDGYLPIAAPGWEPVSAGDAPVIQIFAEGDLPLFGAIGPDGYLAAREDSDAAGDRFRSYQVAGASHLPTRGLRDAGGLSQLGVILEPGERFTQFPAAPFYQAAFVNLVEWVMRKEPPPHAAPIQITSGRIVTDDIGNAKGGLRSPYVDVAAARYVPARYVRNLIGVELPFSPQRLQQMYGSRAQYLERFYRGIDALVADRFLGSTDGERLKAEEAANPPF